MAKKVKFGKQKYSATEFDENLLPSNRFKQFFDVIKIEWSTLLKLGFIFLLFAMPLIIIFFLEPIIVSSLSSGLEANGETELLIRQSVNLAETLYFAICGICFLILSIGFAGASKVIKNVCFAEGVLFKNDFFSGIKENGFRFASFTLIGSVVFFMVYTCGLYVKTSNDFMFSIFAYIALFLFFLFVLPTIFFAMANTTIYKMKFGECLSNGYKQTVVKGLPIALFSVVIYGFTFVQNISHPVLSTFIFILGIVLMMPLFYLAWHLFSLSIFDVYINKDNYPEIYRKGLRPLLSQER